MKVKAKDINIEDIRTLADDDLSNTEGRLRWLYWHPQWRRNDRSCSSKQLHG